MSNIIIPSSYSSALLLLCSDLKSMLKKRSRWSQLCKWLQWEVHSAKSHQVIPIWKCGSTIVDTSASCPIVVSKCPDSCQVKMPDFKKSDGNGVVCMAVWALVRANNISAIQWPPSHLKTDVSLGEENKALSTQLCCTSYFDEKGGFPSLWRNILVQSSLWNTNLKGRFWGQHQKDHRLHSWGNTSGAFIPNFYFKNPANTLGVPIQACRQQSSR